MDSWFSRVLPPKARKLTDSLVAWLFKFAGKAGEAALEKLVYCIVAGRFSKHPFEGQISDLKFQWATLFCYEGHGRPLGRCKKGQTFDFGFLHQLGSYLVDPDFKSMAEFTAGVRFGVDVDLARNPAVWPPKTKWPLNEFGEDPVSELNANYPSVRLHREALLLEVQDQVERGWAVQTTLGEATKKFGAVSISSLSII